MNTGIHSEPPMSQLPESASENARRAADAGKEAAERASIAAKEATHAVDDVAGDVTHGTKDAVKRAADTAKDMYQSASVKAGDALENSKVFVRRNPVPAVLGALAFGTMIGCMLMWPRRRPTFGERYEDEPLAAVRDAIMDALTPVAKRVHRGYDSARDGAGKVLGRVDNFRSGCNGHSFSDQIGRIGNNLKFW